MKIGKIHSKVKLCAACDHVYSCLFRFLTVYNYDGKGIIGAMPERCFPCKFDTRGLTKWSLMINVHDRWGRWRWRRRRRWLWRWWFEDDHDDDEDDDDDDDYDNDDLKTMMMIMMTMTKMTMMMMKMMMTMMTMTMMIWRRWWW